MPIIDNRTANRDYLLPDPTNDMQDDVVRLITTFTAIDADIKSLLDSVSARALLVHTHSFSEIPGLQTALDGKSNIGHLHSLASLTDVSVGGAANGQFLKRVAGSWQPANPAISDVVGLQTALSAERPISNITGLTTALNGKASLSGENDFEVRPTFDGEEPWDTGNLPIDITTTPPNVGDGFVWNGTKLVPGPAGGGMFKGESGTVGTRKGDIFRIAEQQLDASVTIATGENAYCPGPLTIADGVTLTIEAGANLVIL